MASGAAALCQCAPLLQPRARARTRARARGRRRLNLVTIPSRCSFPSLPASVKLPPAAVAFVPPPFRPSLICSRPVLSRSTPENVVDCLEEDRPPFDVKLAILLAGFSFESYNTPPENAGVCEVDPYECKTMFLSDEFLHKIYDGQFLILLKRASNLPAMDAWGTSDPYVVLRIGNCVVKSRTVWASKDPVWNERFTINVKDPETQYLQVAAWDANIVLSHSRLGNVGVSLESLCDGQKHEAELKLEGIGGGGVIFLEVQYKSFLQIEAEKQGWRIPLVSDIFQGKGLKYALGSVFGGENIRVRDFVASAFSFIQAEKLRDQEVELQISDNYNQVEPRLSESIKESGIESIRDDNQFADGEGRVDKEWSPLQNLSESINTTLESVGVEKLRDALLGCLSWDGNDEVERLGLESQTKAEAQYVENGLAAPIRESENDNTSSDSDGISNSIPSQEEIRKASANVRAKMEETLGSWAVLASSIADRMKQNESKSEVSAIVTENGPGMYVNNGAPSCNVSDESLADSEEKKRLRKMFMTAETAVEAWAMLGISVGHASFIKSEFEKICFLDNEKSDTQAAIWRDVRQRRLVVAFRGTEQVKWKDLRTDLMMLPSGFEPERVGGDFNKERMVHSGFLSAYDSVRKRAMSLLKLSMDLSEDEINYNREWHVYVTGHSLGGALATLFAFELSSSELLRLGKIKLTMYNFGSPRVGNKQFANQYNKKVKDSWRVVNYRDIIPSVPRLLGYCHVAQPIYLTAGEFGDLNASVELLDDGYHGDLIGEATPDFLVEEFMEGGQELIQKILQTEIAILRSFRDGSALMQHMEDFYYISLLEYINKRTSGASKSKSPIAKV